MRAEKEWPATWESQERVESGVWGKCFEKRLSNDVSYSWVKMRTET